MTNQKNGRALSTAFLNDLQDGVLSPLLRRVQNDTSLDLEFRGHYVNVYYRGGSILRVERQGSGYRVFFDPKYSAVPLPLPKARIADTPDAQSWVECIRLLKDAMDLWFGAHPKDERAAQQLVVHENNVGSWANGTDYFIVDIEYDNHRGARFDLVALRWDSEATSRKLQNSYVPTLSVIEMKTGDGAVNGEAGLTAHYQQWVDFFGDVHQRKAFEHDMLAVFEQKRQLGLIPVLKHNPKKIVRVAAEVEAIFLLANHKPASRTLMASVRAIDEGQNVQLPGFRIGFATATFMGFGLYAQNILPLDAFRQQLERIAKKIG